MTSAVKDKGNQDAIAALLAGAWSPRRTRHVSPKQLNPPFDEPAPNRSASPPARFHRGAYLTPAELEPAPVPIAATKVLRAATAHARRSGGHGDERSAAPDNTDRHATNTRYRWADWLGAPGQAGESP
jgi:hypothetical protein